jgi:small subunit ribosomal protein S3
MGQKTHPLGLRLALNKKWSSVWFDSKRYVELLHKDLELRDYLTKKLRQAGCERVDIERSANEITITAHVSKPGMAIGRGGSGIELLKKELQSKLGGDKLKFNILEVRKPDLSATLVARNVADMIERRMAPRRAVNMSVERTMSSGAKGVKIMVSGRLNGADIARSEKKAVGTIPLHTLRADIDFASDVAITAFGTIGVKVWICKEPEKTITPSRNTAKSLGYTADESVDSQKTKENI